MQSPGTKLIKVGAISHRVPISVADLSDQFMTYRVTQVPSNAIENVKPNPYKNRKYIPLRLRSIKNRGYVGGGV